MAAPEARATWLARHGAREAGVDRRAARSRGTMLDWAQIRELHAAGWTIGAHTVTHSNVALIEPAEAEREIAESRDALAAAIGAPGPPLLLSEQRAGSTVLRRRRSPAHAAASRVPLRHHLAPGALRPGADPFLAAAARRVSPRLAPCPSWRRPSNGSDWRPERMCGIAGELRLTPGERASAERVRAMCDVMVHRGPTRSASTPMARSALGMRRLSIVDVAGGLQPLGNEDGSVQVVCNGEIYNAPALTPRAARRAGTGCAPAPTSR